MKPNISERVIKPEHCVLAFGIPLLRDDFLKDLSNPNKNFARKFHGVWEKYYEEIVCDFEMIKPRLSELGLALCPELTFEKFGSLFHEGFDVIILFSHWEYDAIEFYDGFVNYKDIVEKVPESFDRVLDLTVCHPEQLVVALRRERPRCLIRSKTEKRKLIPHYWLFFFLALFTHLKSCDLNYLQAVEDVIAGFRKKFGRDSSMKQLYTQKLKQKFELYLNNIGRLNEVPLGEGDERPVKNEDNQHLIQLLDQHIKSNNYLIIIAIIILCLCLIGAILLLISYRQNPEAIKLVSGGTMIFALGAMRWLHRFWIQRAFIAICLTILQKMPPEQAADVMTQLYWAFIRQPNKSLMK